MEELYRALLPNLPRYIIILLKVMLAASPSVKNYTGTVDLSWEGIPLPLSPTLSLMMMMMMTMMVTTMLLLRWWCVVTSIEALAANGSGTGIKCSIVPSSLSLSH